MEGNKMLYIVVVDNDDHSNENDDDDDNSKSKNNKREKGEFGNDSVFCYTRPVLQNTLQFIGCKARHAFEISKRVFETVKSQSSSEGATRVGRFVADTSNIGPKVHDLLSSGKKLSSELYKRRTTVFISRTKFLDVICDALTEYKYIGPKQRKDLILACRIRERRESVIILLCGTSGCGKSTLSSLLGSRLGITTVVSTDSIRHMMRSFVDEKDNPLLWASTYHAGECLDPVAVAKAEERKKARKKARTFSNNDNLPENVSNEKLLDSQSSEPVSNILELVGPRRMAIEGYKAQSEMVIESLDRLITAWEEKKESVIVEGVHLSLNFVMGLMKKHPSIIPFMIYIPEEDKHVERFAVRAKYMTLDPSKNKYVKYIKNIRRIQEYLSYRADKHLVPKINNTNVDKSVTAIHATLFSCLRRREAGEQLYNSSTNTVNAICEEYRNHRASNSFTSKGMFQLIQKSGSSRNFMAPVNLQFGNLGVRGWAREPGSTSYTGSVDDLRGEITGTENGSMCCSSCCSSPQKGDCPAKKIKENLAVSDSDEEVNDHPEADSDDDLSDGGRFHHEEIEGSVDEESTKSDEEYDDLAMQYDLQSGYWSDDEADVSPRTQSGHVVRHNVLHSSLIMEKTEIKRPHSRTRIRSLSIPNFDKHGAAFNPWLKVGNNISPVI